MLLLVSDEDSGPQVSGQYSRRREQANKRMDRAAALRKGATAEMADSPTQSVGEPEVASAPAEDAVVPDADESADDESLKDE